MKKPRVITRCVANHYATGRERIIEFAGADPAKDGGGLISFFQTERGTTLVCLYHLGSDVEVRVALKEGR